MEGVVERTTSNYNEEGKPSKLGVSPTKQKSELELAVHISAAGNQPAAGAEQAHAQSGAREGQLVEQSLQNGGKPTSAQSSVPDSTGTVDKVSPSAPPEEDEAVVTSSRCAQLSASLTSGALDLGLEQQFDWILAYLFFGVSTIVLSLLAMQDARSFVCPETCVRGDCHCSESDSIDDVCGETADYDDVECERQPRELDWPWYMVLLLILLPLLWYSVVFSYLMIASRGSTDCKCDSRFCTICCCVIVTPLVMAISGISAYFALCFAWLFTFGSWIFIPMYWTVCRPFGSARKDYSEMENKETHWCVFATIVYNDDWRFFLVWIVMACYTWGVPVLVLVHAGSLSMLIMMGYYILGAFGVDYIVIVVGMVWICEMRLSKAILLGIGMTHMVVLDVLNQTMWFVGYWTLFVARFFYWICTKRRDETSGDHEQNQESAMETIVDTIAMQNSESGTMFSDAKSAETVKKT